MPQYFWTDLEGWACCKKCNCGRKHRIGFDISVQGKQIKIKQCCSCGEVTERKPETRGRKSTPLPPIMHDGWKK